MIDNQYKKCCCGYANFHDSGLTVTRFQLAQALENLNGPLNAE